MTVSIQPKGAGFIRAALAMASAPEDATRAAEIAVARWGAGSSAAAVAKASAGATSGGWGEDLAGADTENRAFFALVAERAVIGRLRGTRPTPLRVRVMHQTDGATAAWRDEAGAVAVSAPGFESATMAPHSLAGMTVITNELLEGSNPEAEPLVRADLSRAIAEGLDSALLWTDHEIDHAPAAITTGAPTLASSGDLAGDLKELVAGFDGDLSTSFFITSPTTAFFANGIEFPNVGARGGDLAGVPVLVSRMSPPGQIALVDAAGLAVGQGEVQLRSSKHASINFAAEPEAPSQLVDLWSTGSVAIMASVAINWRVARPGSVSVLVGVGEDEGS